MAEVRRSIAIHNGHPRLRLVRREIASAIAVLDAHAAAFLGGCPPGELSIVFLTDPALAQIHAAFMNDPSATDVITFEGDRATEQAGEICVSIDTAARYVGFRFGNKTQPSPRVTVAVRARFSAELTLYLIHGWLHLAGYDDLQPAKKRRMRAAEKRALTLLRRNGVLPVFRLS
jgi:probable rRNA maturation factor